MENYFLKDATRNFRRTTALLQNTDFEADSAMDAALYFAFGSERFFKAIIWNVNPILVLDKPAPENSIHVLYKDKLLPTVKAEKETFPHTLGYIAALQRASMFSPTAANHRGLFTALSEYRNIIAHDGLQFLDDQKAHRFCHAHFYPMALALAGELHLNATEVFGDDFSGLADESERLRKVMDIQKAVEEKLDKCRKKWELIKDSEDDCHYATFMTRTYVEGPPDESSDVRYHALACPACGQKAILDTIEESDSPESTGFTIRMLHCEFCDLEVIDQIEMDYLELYPRIQRNLSTHRFYFDINLIKQKFAEAVSPQPPAKE